MATFNITFANSVSATTGAAFESGTANPDTLIVQEGGLLRSQNSSAVDLAGPGAWTVVIDGQIESAASYALYLGTGITGTSSITVGVTGAVEGNILARSSALITNRGVVLGDIGYGSGGGGTITNYGTIYGDINGPLSTSIFKNYGKVYGKADFRFGSGNDEIVNGGQFIYQGSGGTGLEKIDMGDGANKFTVLAGSSNFQRVVFGSGNDIFSNAGIQSALVDMGNGADIFTNSGTITGNVGMGLSDTAVDRFTNTGTLTGDAQFGNGSDIIVNRGRITGELLARSGNNTISNSGIIGSVSASGNLGDDGGDNVFTNYIITGTTKKSGTVTGSIFFGAGNDTLKGGDKAENVFDNNGADTYSLAGGNDAFFASYLTSRNGNDSADYVNGGAGTDTYHVHDGLASPLQTIINLDTVSHRNGPGFLAPLDNAAAANTVKYGSRTVDRIYNFENVVGSSGRDIVYGNASANRLEGKAGNDNLFGYAGNDVLNGGDNSDNLEGGLGRDVLTGGTGLDYFIFNSAAETPVGSATRDVIVDFNDAEGDQISLHGLDANTTNGTGIDDFTDFMGVNVAFNGPGQTRAIRIHDGWLVEGNTDNDAAPEFQIKVLDAGHSIVWGADDFFI